MQTRVLAIVLACCGSGICASALADDRGDLWLTRPNALEVHAGLGTPVGFLGLVYDRVLIRRLSASAGLGLGSGKDGASLQLAAGVRFRVLQLAETGLSIGADYSTGGWRYLDFIPVFGTGDGSTRQTSIIYSERVHWIAATVGWEYRKDSGYVLRTYAGLATMLNPSSRDCVTETGDACALTAASYGDPTILVLGLSLGFTG